jgi:hypothetical protein
LAAGTTGVAVRAVALLIAGVGISMPLSTTTTTGAATSAVAPHGLGKACDATGIRQRLGVALAPRSHRRRPHRQPTISGDHHPDPDSGQPVNHHAGKRGEQQHWSDLGDDHAGDP